MPDTLPPQCADRAQRRPYLALKRKCACRCYLVALDMVPNERFGAVLLLGTPGVGKSLLLSLLAERLGPSAVALNVGEELRQRGLVQPYLEAPTEARRLALDREAGELIAAACRRLKAEDPAAGPRWVINGHQGRLGWQ